ncbi:hypothetical protein M011DRAFT_471152 [Sporormia fimetaria CBS 119925]|uniref:Uncharacterized protein n=1 Tax=Sporormia fimetaria CBS 119925 TaxID=1340428 RepID=A0A6A6UZX2_9PLEO|nr:hypothetical protein M011DRAFT_471152 [Sporormia fimetaria CBS 119925]
MPQPPSDAFAALESAFNTAPAVAQREVLSQRKNDLHSVYPAAEPIRVDTAHSDHDAYSVATSQDVTPLASPGPTNAADTGLPPTPPTIAQENEAPEDLTSPEIVDRSLVAPMSKQPSLRTPAKQRSPPTPDPSPPRTAESSRHLARPTIFAYPSSRAESFKTAREDPYSTDVTESRSSTPLVGRLGSVDEDGDMGREWERGSDSTPTRNISEDTQAGAEQTPPPRTPERDWDPHLMRNVTIRKRRTPKVSPHKDAHATPRSVSATVAAPHTPSYSHKRATSHGSPLAPSIEQFAQSIGWPAGAPSTPRQTSRPVENKRLSGSSMNSSIVEATVIVTPPRIQARRTLRHSGKNLAYVHNENSSTERVSRTRSNTASADSEDVPLNRLIHKRASVSNRAATGPRPDSMSGGRTASPTSTVSLRSRTQDSAAITRAHQDAVRNILQPAVMIMSRSNSLSRSHGSDRAYHKRMSSAPEPSRRVEARPSGARRLAEWSPPSSPKEQPPQRPRAPSLGQRSRHPDEAGVSSDLNRPYLKGPLRPSDSITVDSKVEDKQAEKLSPSPARADMPSDTYNPPSHRSNQQSVSPLRSLEQKGDASPGHRRGSLSSRGRPEERRRNSGSRDRTSTSRETHPLPSLDRIPTEELPRRSQEWRSLSPNDYRRMSFDRYTPRSDEHAMARHLFAATTPFSQFSDTPIEVSEATAVSIYPHTNNSLLVVQQVAQPSITRAMPLEQREVPDDRRLAADPATPDMASQGVSDGFGEGVTHTDQPIVTVEPSTPPRQITLPVPGAVDSPLKNPRTAPEPPVIKFIPPTPADEIDCQLGPNPPGPPARSESHPQRRLSIVQRARRYSEDLITPFLSRNASQRGRHASAPHSRDKTQAPTVAEGDGSLHPFWRPRGFWDGFDDSDSDEDDRLPQGGDTSDVEPEPERKPGALVRRLTNGFKGSGGFLIGNSLGVERHGTNKRKPHIILPSQRSASSSSASMSMVPKILVQRPTFPLLMHRSRVQKRGSRGSMRSSSERGGRKEAWKSGKKIPGVGLQVQYIGLSGVKERIRERKAEKRRQEIRKSIGTRYYVDRS